MGALGGYNARPATQGTTMTADSFSRLPVRPQLLSAIAALGYTDMTQVQAQALPHLLQGDDVIVQAQTGSGKTAAFAIALLNKLDEQDWHTQALVVCPTRELAEQVSVEIRRIGSAIANIKLLTLCGGKPMGPQLVSLQREPHIVVGTPGRLLKHLEKGTLQAAAIQTLVLDEADRMLDMGFYEDIMQIINLTPKLRQTLLFSATYPQSVRDMSVSVQREPVDIRVTDSHKRDDIEQVFYQVDPQDRVDALIRIIGHYLPESCLVFCNTKQQCEDLAGALRQRDLHAQALHGDLEQFRRDEVLTQFSGKSSSILVATDVAARGLDVKDLVAVVNFELARDPEVHIHRIGRTARAGNKGLAVSLYTSREAQYLRAIEQCQGITATTSSLNELGGTDAFKLYPPMVTLVIQGGRKQKVRPGDILGALTASGELTAEQIGKITLFDKVSYVAIAQRAAKSALTILEQGKIKGRKFRVRRLR